LVDWTRMRGTEALDAVVARLRGTGRVPADPSTAIASARAFGGALLAQMPQCWKHTLDLSGDGKSNTGPHPRDLAPPPGVTVNGLVIGADSPSHTDARQSQIGELTAYYRAYVIAGPDAFVETALGFEDFEAAMVRKLLRELATLGRWRGASAPQ
jgi:hypothetical protein